MSKGKHQLLLRGGKISSPEGEEAEEKQLD
jgi:hypothetical protein